MKTTPGAPESCPWFGSVQTWSPISTPQRLASLSLSPASGSCSRAKWGRGKKGEDGWERWKTFSMYPKGTTIRVVNICENSVVSNIGEKNVRNHNIKHIQTDTQPLWKTPGELRTEINVPRRHRVGGLLNQLVLNSGAHTELPCLVFKIWTTF